MPDPAVEAVQRALGKNLAPDIRYYSTAAAREALKPIKEKFEVWCATLLRDNHPDAQSILMVLNDIAPFVYSTEELEK